MSEINKEVTEIKLVLEKIECIIDSRLIGVEEPETNEIEEIEEYEKRKKQSKTEVLRNV